MASRSHNTVRKVAARAVPAFLVAGLGFSLPAAPALAETATITAAEEIQLASTDAVWSGVDSETEEKTDHDTLADALRKDYYYISLKKNVAENIETTANPEWTEDTAGEHYYTDVIVMNGHALKGTNKALPTINNKGMLEFRNAPRNQGQTVRARSCPLLAVQLTL